MAKNNQHINNSLDAILNGINELRSDFKSLHSEYKSLHSDFKALHSDFITLQTDFTSLRTDYKSLEKKLQYNHQKFYNDIKYEIKYNQRKLIKKLKKINNNNNNTNNIDNKEEVTNSHENEINEQSDANNGENDETNMMCTEETGNSNLKDDNNKDHDSRKRNNNKINKKSNHNYDDSSSDESSDDSSLDRLRKQAGWINNNNSTNDLTTYCGIGPHLALGTKKRKNSTNHLAQGRCIECHNGKSIHVCSVCKDNAEQMLLNNDSNIKVKIPYICHTKTGRDCFIQHLANKHSDVISKK